MPPKHKIRARDIRGMSPEERLKLLREMQVELVTLRYKASVGTLTNPGRLREVKRNIARVLTVMKEEVKGARGGAEQG